MVGDVIKWLNMFACLPQRYWAHTYTHAHTHTSRIIIGFKPVSQSECKHSTHTHTHISLCLCTDWCANITWVTISTTRTTTPHMLPALHLHHLHRLYLPRLLSQHLHLHLWSSHLKIGTQSHRTLFMLWQDSSQCRRHVCVGVRVELGGLQLNITLCGTKCAPDENGDDRPERIFSKGIALSLSLVLFSSSLIFYVCCFIVSLCVSIACWLRVVFGQIWGNHAL